MTLTEAQVNVLIGVFALFVLLVLPMLFLAAAACFPEWLEHRRKMRQMEQEYWRQVSGEDQSCTG